MEGAGRSAALDKRQNRVLVRKAATLRHVILLTDEGFINFNYPAAAA